MTPRDTTQATQNQDRCSTETRPRYQRDMAESMNFSILKHHSSTYGPQLHWYAQKGAQYSNSNWNLRFCLETRSKCLSMFISLSPKNQSTITKAKKTAQQHQRHNTKPSPTHHQNITAPSPHIKETSPKHARDVTNTSLKDPQNTTKLPTKQHQNNTETSPKKDRDKTETSQRHHQNHPETSPRQDRDKTKTRPRQDRDITETSLRHHRDKTETRPRQDRDKEASSVDIRATAFCHSYTGLPKGAQYTSSNSNWNVRFCLETRSKCLSMFISLSPKNQNTITKAKKQHSNINDTTPSHHPLIIKTSQHHHQTSRGLHRYMPETSPTHH